MKEQAEFSLILNLPMVSACFHIRENMRSVKKKGGEKVRNIHEAVKKISQYFVGLCLYVIRHSFV